MKTSKEFSWTEEMIRQADDAWYADQEMIRAMAVELNSPTAVGTPGTPGDGTLAPSAVADRRGVATGQHPRLDCPSRNIEKGIPVRSYHCYHVALYFPKGYIADPYWPEREELINIQKASGMNRSRSEKKREEALADYLKKIGMPKDQYDELEKLAERPWYRKDLADERSEIIVPNHHLYGCLIEAAKKCSSSLRPCEPENLRYVFQVSDFSTGKTSSDGIFKRLVMPKSGTGQPLSNQRALRMNPYIEDFVAVGHIGFYPEDVRENGKSVQDFLEYAGHRVGVGASRKMSFGRFILKEFSLKSER